jgi:hypothetical protein
MQVFWRNILSSSAGLKLHLPMSVHSAKTQFITTTTTIIIIIIVVIINLIAVKTSDLMERSLVTVSNAMEEGLC